MATSRPKSYGPGTTRSAGFVPPTSSGSGDTLRGPDLWTVVIDEDPAPNPYGPSVSAPIGETEAYGWTKAEKKRLEEHRRREAELNPPVEIHDDFVF